MARKAALTAVLVALLLGITLLAFTERNGGCLPWQQRVGYGDGPLGPGQDFTACRGRAVPLLFADGLAGYGGR